MIEVGKTSPPDIIVYRVAPRLWVVHGPGFRCVSDKNMYLAAFTDRESSRKRQPNSFHPQEAAFV